MAGEANTPRQSSCRVVNHHLEGIKLVAGILIKATRAYKSAANPNGLTQADIATATGINQGLMSQFENGKYLPDDLMLSKVLTASGFDLAKPGTAAFEKLLRFIRDNEDDLRKLENEYPDS